MSIMSFLSIEKTRKVSFVLVGGLNCFSVIVCITLRISQDVDLTGGKIDRVHGLLETLENRHSSKDANIDFILKYLGRR